MKLKFKKNWWIWLIVGVLCCAMLGGIIYAIVAATDNGKVKTKTISASEFSLGGLDENGKYIETKESIYTKDAFECYGLKTSLEFDNNITYALYFYTEEGEFISKTGTLTSGYDCDKQLMPAETTHCRVVITPEKKDGKAVTMNVFNKSKYAKQLTIKVNKNQDVQDGVYVPINVLNLPSTFVGKDYKWSDSGKSFSEYDGVPSLRVGEILNVQGYTTLTLYVSAVENNTRVRFASDMDGTDGVQFATADGSMIQPTESTDVYVRYDFVLNASYIYCGITVSCAGVESYAPVVYLS